MSFSGILYWISLLTHRIFQRILLESCWYWGLWNGYFLYLFSFCFLVELLWNWKEKEATMDLKISKIERTWGLERNVAKTLENLKIYGWDLCDWIAWLPIVCWPWLAPNKRWSSGSCRRITPSLAPVHASRVVRTRIWSKRLWRTRSHQLR